MFRKVTKSFRFSCTFGLIIAGFIFVPTVTHAIWWCGCELSGDHTKHLCAKVISSEKPNSQGCFHACSFVSTKRYIFSNQLFLNELACTAWSKKKLTQ
jgi:hypothetical protein